MPDLPGAAEAAARGRPRSTRVDFGSNGAFVFVIVAMAAALVLATLLPTLLLERMRDWTTFAASADRLAHGRSLYFVDGEVMAIYPPAMAVVWSFGMTEWVWRAIDVVAALQVAWLVVPRQRLGAAALLALQAPLAYELITGNMMAMFAGALAIHLAFRRWPAAAPLGIVVAIAAKPFMVPVLVVLLVVRTRDTLPVVAVALVVTLIGVIVAGLNAQLEYPRALLAFAGQIGDWTNGNLGVSRLGGPWPAIAIALAVAATGFAVLRRPAEAAIGVGVCAGFLVQPSLGYYYGFVLAVPLLILWSKRRGEAVMAALASCFASIVSPVIGALLVGGLLLRRTPGPAADPSLPHAAGSPA